ncbi:MAG: hypothetical protein IPL79_00915 [Myxococcales bacterium]|nr:hypothetical protein [Myxococcales bacterium]
MKRPRRVMGMIAVGWLVATASPGDADVVRLDVATELDSNVHRVDGQEDARPGMLTRVTAAGRGQRAWDELGAWGNARLGLRRALDAELGDENAATVGGEAGASVQATENVRWVLRGSGLVYAGTASTSAVRDVAMGSGDAALLVGDASGHRAWARVGLVGVVLPDVIDSSYRGSAFETGWSWSKDDEDDVSQWQASVSYERELRTFEGVGLIEGCAGGAAAACATATTEPRRDDVHTLAATMQRSSA